MPAKEPTERRAQGARTARVAEVVKDQRVTAIMGWLAHGLRPKHIGAAVAEAAKLERVARRKYRAELAALQAARLRGEPIDESTPAPTPPRFVWGDAEPAVSQRQIERYLAAARVRFAEEGRELNKNAVEVLGLTWHRLNDLYRRALDDKRYTTCRMLIRDTMEMFGLIGAIRVQLMPAGGAIAAGDGTDAEPAASGPIAESQWTPEQLAREWNDITAIAVRRMREQREQQRAIADSRKP